MFFTVRKFEECKVSETCLQIHVVGMIIIIIPSCDKFITMHASLRSEEKCTVTLIVGLYAFTRGLLLVARREPDTD